MQENLSIILDRGKSKAGGWLVTLNTEMLAKITHDSDYHSLLKAADMFVADGMPLVWASRHKPKQCPQAIVERTTGVDIIDQFLRKKNIPPYAIIGGNDPATTLSQYTGATDQCKLLFSGKVDESEAQLQSFTNEISKNNIQFVFIALGTPKQDRVALALRELAPQCVYIGVGGTFEILAPGSSRAPGWMQKSGLEWFYRLSKEPGRLWKRYILHYPLGIYALLKDSLTR
jgi:N-acetylglucosaminyldiphosphoundecaprenol N-acetyl-beta-D-mannosaminyltransferase